MRTHTLFYLFIFSLFLQVNLTEAFAKTFAKTRVQQSPKITPAPETRTKPTEPAYFELTQNKKNLILRFTTVNPDLYLNLKEMMVAHFTTIYPFKVIPQLILNRNWPKNGKQMTLQVQGANPKYPNYIQGKVAYTYCNKRTRSCKKTIIPLIYYYRVGS